MSQFVYICPCGWRSIAENTGGVGQRGEAPPHCRRCGKNAFTRTSERHPKITHVCKDCREDFIGHVGAKYCQRCMPKHRGKAIWDGRRKYEWTPERDQILRDHYKSNATEIARRFFPGWEKWVITHRAQQLGLCRTKEKPWTKAEDAFLREHAGTRTPHWMQKQLRTRTTTAIVVRLKRLNISRRIQADGLTLSQLEQAIGIDHRQIVAWFRSGRLKGTYRTNPHEHERYEFQEADVAAFLLANPSAFRLDRVDQAWFMGLMREAAGHGPHQQRLSASADVSAKPRKAAAAAKPVPVSEMVACLGVDDETPCPNQKTVIRRGSIPPRCPDCMLALRRQLHTEERGRLQRIRASAPPERASA